MVLAPQRDESAPDLHIRTSRHGQYIYAKRVAAVGRSDRGSLREPGLKAEVDYGMARRAGV